MFGNKKLFFFLLSAIFILAFILRFYKLSSFPVGFHIDEASKGYNAYSILKTGRDDNNHFLPLSIDIFGDNSPAGYHYSAILPVAVFGLTEFAVRFPGALFGTLSILAFYFLVYSIFKDRKISLVSALLLAISPWHINLSRASSESLIALFFIIFGFGFIIWSLRTQNSKHVIIGTIILAISFFFYQTPRLFVPLLFLTLIVFHFKIWKVKVKDSFKRVFIFAFLALCVLDFLLIFIVPGGSGRFHQVNIFSYPETRLVMDEQIREDGVMKTQVFQTRFFHNKPVNFFVAYVSNYLEYFSWNFLFIKGLPAWYFIPNMGVMYLSELPFVLYGILKLWMEKSRFSKIPFLWLVLAPSAAAVAIDINNLQRAIVLFPMLEMLAAVGVVRTIEQISNSKSKILNIHIKYVIFALCFLFFIFSSSVFCSHKST